MSKDFSDSRCSIARSLSIVSDAWSILILRDLAQGFTQYDEFRKSLGISPSILSKRLTELTDACLVEKNLYQTNPPRYAYTLTKKGQDFLPVIATLLAFGNKHASPHGVDTLLIDKNTQKRIDPVVVDERTGERLNFKNLVFGGGPGASKTKIANLKRRNLPIDGL